MVLPTDGAPIDQLEPLEKVSESKRVKPVVELEISEELLVEATEVQITRLNLATDVRDPENDTPRNYGHRARSQTWRLE